MNVLYIKNHLQVLPYWNMEVWKVSDTIWRRFGARKSHFLVTFQGDNFLKMSDFENFYVFNWFSLGGFRDKFLDIYALWIHVLYIKNHLQTLLYSFMKVWKVSDTIWRQFGARKLHFLESFQVEYHQKCYIWKILIRKTIRNL